ncbi:pheromone-regulated protein PRM7-like [Pecten maximus]|uniref:pheromone-regulated protein PRM7-like n=1 Tax=Pecten maximus TaxID=6579 RepID=UPI0014590433|nr:pheromone-regulated protein PRM7-like [Pecten maximus]
MTQFFVNSGVMSLDLCADACDGTTAKLFAIEEFSTLKYESVELIEATCLWIGINNISNGTAGLLKLRRIDSKETFISAPYLAVVGWWSEAITEAETTTNVEETTEAETITEAETATKAVTTTANGLLTITSSITTTAETTVVTTAKETTVVTTAIATTVVTTAADTTEVTTGAETTTPEAETTETDWSAAATTEQTSTETEPVVTDQPTMNTGASSSPDGQTSAVETSTLLSSHVTVSGGICKCRCKNFSNMTREELIARLKALRAELGVNVTELSSYLRKFISVPDSRPSAVGVGVVGVVILAFVVGTIAVLDLTTFLKPKK